MIAMRIVMMIVMMTIVGADVVAVQIFAKMRQLQILVYTCQN